MKNTDKDWVFILFICVHLRFNFLILQNSTDSIEPDAGSLGGNIDAFHRQCSANGRNAPCRGTPLKARSRPSRCHIPTTARPRISTSPRAS